MKITRVDFANLKGATGPVVLGPATLIYGRNFTGKTTSIDAIKLGASRLPSGGWIRRRRASWSWRAANSKGGGRADSGTSGSGPGAG